MDRGGARESIKRLVLDVGHADEGVAHLEGIPLLTYRVENARQIVLALHALASVYGGATPADGTAERLRLGRRILIGEAGGDDGEETCLLGLEVVKGEEWGDIRVARRALVAAT